MSERIHLSKADVGEVEEQFVLRALRSGWVAPLGPDVDAFEREIAEHAGVGHALALSSGTAALHLALLHVGAGPGKVVVLPSMTFAASANAVAYTGAEPVFVDSQASDGNIDPTLLFEALDALSAEGVNIAAVMTVDLLGRCADYDQISEELTRRGIPLVEDAAEAFGAQFKAQPAGSFGQASALSFNGNKLLTTSGGGMLLSDDAALIERARYLSTQARQPTPWYEHTEVGYNYRMSNILAAIGRAQITRLPGILKRRLEMRVQYSQMFAEIPGVSILGHDTGVNSHHVDNHWLTALILDPERSPFTPGQLASYLDAHNIESRPIWKPMHTQPLYKNARSFANGISETLFERGITLPSGSSISDLQRERLVTVLAVFLDKKEHS